MKKLLRKNQVILTVLAVLVAIAGYLTLTGNDPTATALQSADEQVSATNEDDEGLDDQVTAENAAVDTSDTEDSEDSEDDDAAVDADDGIEDDEVISNPGEAVLTSGVTVADFMADARLSREQVRASNKETLLEIINSEAISDEQKEEAISSMLELTEVAEKENATETLLHAKGFTDALVSIVDDQVNVVIAQTSITEAEKAQIEDIVKQKTEMSTEQIVISLMDLAE